ncbi:MAG: glycosyltransferase family 2 protein [Phycisphaerales bacterium]|nr:glycosyltransferase family 2 protein [Phycisphaerales bacterium]
MPAVSVVIPVYNREGIVEHAIRSVQAQTFSDFELIVVDDGSADDSAGVVRRLAADDERIKVIEQANTGAGGARHAGIKASVAPFVAFLDSDDSWEPSYLTEQLSLIREAPDDVIAVVCNGTAVEPGKPDVSLFEEVWYEPPDVPRIVDRPRELWEPFQAPYLQGSVYRRSALVEIDAFGLHLPCDEDFEMLVRMSFAGRYLVNPAHLFTHDRGRGGYESLSQTTKLSPGFFEARCIAAAFAYAHDTDAALRAKDKKAYLRAYRSWLRSLAGQRCYGQVVVRVPGLMRCGFDLKSALFGLLMLTGPIGATLWEWLSALKESRGRDQIERMGAGS